MNEISVDNTIVIPEENNTTVDTNIVNSEEIETDNLLTSDDIAMQLDYYDRYYEDVLNHLEDLETYQETIIDNQETMITKFNTFDIFLSTIIFLITFIFVYNFLRNMIITK